MGPDDSQQPPASDGGGIDEALATCAKVLGAVAESDVPDQIKAQASQLRDGVAALADAIAGGGDASGGGAVSPEQGGSSGAVPETMGARR